jgi:hypothetical protein
VAPLLADVIFRIHEGRSVGELFDDVEKLQPLLLAV